MVRVIDLHNHLETLPHWASFRSKLQGHVYSLEGHIKEDTQVILGVAMYIQIYQGFDELLVQIKNLKKEIARFGKQVRLITRKEDLIGDFKVGIILHLESARILTNYQTQLIQLYDLGIRGIIPSHFKDNFIGNSCDDPLRRLKIKSADHGMSEEGYRLIDKMNSLGMWADLSHTMDVTAEQMLKMANEVMVSHVAIRDLVPRMRNKPISFLQDVAKKGGIFGLTPWQHLIGNSEKSYGETLKYILDQGLESAICIGTDLGAPIKTHLRLKSTFDCATQAQSFSASQKIIWDNAFNFYHRVLPS